MSTQPLPMAHLTGKRLLQSVRNLLRSEVGSEAKLWLLALVSLSVGVNGLNVLSSYVGRDFMSAVADHRMTDFVREGVLYVGVFALTTGVVVLYRFTEERLGLLWRHWLTGRLVTFYMSHRVYYRLDETGAIANPDQRITEDVRSFTVTTLSFIVMLLNGTFTVVAFSGVLWSISHWLFGFSIAYALVGTWLAIRFGRRLVRLNYDQLDKEANFRADLIHVRENAESIAMLHRESRLHDRLMRGLEALVANFQRIVTVNRNLNFFTTGYNYLIQLLPVFFVAPLYIRGETEFGEITQAMIAFTQLVGAFSLIVTQFQSISSYAAVMTRLSALGEAIESVAPAEAAGEVAAACGICAAPTPASAGTLSPKLQVVEQDEGLVFQDLTLRASPDGAVLVDRLNLEVPSGTRLLLKSVSEEAKVAVFRATAGIWTAATGTIQRPDLEQILFLPERPYLPPGTLREAMLNREQAMRFSDEEILAVLRELGAEAVVERAGGLDSEQDWDDMLSLGEQQLIAYARLLLMKPRCAFLDRPGTALAVDQVRAILAMLRRESVTYLTLGDGDDQAEDYNLLVELDAAGHAARSRLPVTAGAAV